MSRRVVVTGMGAVTPIGNNVKDFWENVKKEPLESDQLRSLTQPITKHIWLQRLKILIRRLRWIKNPHDVWKILHSMRL